VLASPAVLALAVLVAARITYPHPKCMEPSPPPAVKTRGVHSTFWFYLAALSCMALGFVNYPLAAFHIKTAGVVPDKWIPLTYAGTTGVDALSALILGRLYDRSSLKLLLVVIAASA